MNRTLTDDQIALLKLLYRFRFGTTTSLNQLLDLNSRTSINARLEVLLKRGYIGRRYEKSYKLLGKPATYYLLKESFPILKDQKNISQAVLKNIYKDAQATDKFVDACLGVFELNNLLKAQYGEDLKFFTKSDIANYSYFPKPLPDAFLAYKNGTHTKRFFILTFESSIPTFALNRRLQQFIDYYENGGWDVTNSDFPGILISCETAVLQNRVEKHISRRHDVVNEVVAIATTNQSILSSNAKRAWRLIGEDELLSLREL